MPVLDPHIFRAYDIRGKALTQLTPEACYCIGRGFGSVLRHLYAKNDKAYKPSVIVGRDARTHSPQLEEEVIRGLTEAGCHIFRIGQTPSPINYFTICTRNADGGVQVTASHNPKEDNGLKLQIRNAESHAGDDLQKLFERITKEDFLSGEGIVEEIDAINPYIEHLSTLFKDVGAGKKVVVDGGNGVAGPVYVGVLRRVGCEVIELYTDPDGNFPNHPADPSKHVTLKELQELVKKEKADLGFGYDGDGDRMGLVDEQGRIATADHVLLLLAQDYLKRHKTGSIVFTVSNSGTLESEVKKWGGTPVMSKVGHSFVEHEMHVSGAKVGGEQSGHFFCAEDYFGFDDALVASLRVLSILKQNPSKLSAKIDAFPKVYQMPEHRPFCPDNRKGEVMKKVIEHFSKIYPVNTMDGIRIDFGEGAWAGIRQSNTSPCISLCIEARSQKKLNEVQKIIFDQMKNYPEVEMDA